jgi:branched-chain amino acid transport system permease protein
MEILGPVFVAGITTGALYALATIGLSLVWGALGMLNMAHGALLTIGGYAAFTLATWLGAPWPLAVLAPIVVGAAIGAAIYLLVAHPLLVRAPRSFETNVIIATFGVAIALENAVLLIFGGQPFGQSIALSGHVQLGAVFIPWQNILIVAVVLAMMAGTAFFLARTRTGRAIRATAQNREAAQLLGVPVGRVYLQVLALSGGIAGTCGLLVSSITQLSPSLGADPMLKAFIMCVVAGLGNLPGAIAAAFVLALTEAVASYALGARWGFPLLLAIVILVLIWRPDGLFGRAAVRRL